MSTISKSVATRACAKKNALKEMAMHVIDIAVKDALTKEMIGKSPRISITVTDFGFSSNSDCAAWKGVTQNMKLYHVVWAMIKRVGRIDSDIASPAIDLIINQARRESRDVVEALCEREKCKRSFITIDDDDEDDEIEIAAKRRKLELEEEMEILAARKLSLELAVKSHIDPIVLSDALAAATQVMFAAASDDDVAVKSALIIDDKIIDLTMEVEPDEAPEKEKEVPAPMITNVDDKEEEQEPPVDRNPAPQKADGFAQHVDKIIGQCRAERACVFCFSTEEELGEVFRPIISDVDADSPAKCEHLVCSADWRNLVKDFVENKPTIARFKCDACESKNVYLKRKHMDMNVAQYLVNPSTFADQLSDEQLEIFKMKQAYLDDTTIPTSHAKPIKDMLCPHCRGRSLGPVTRLCSNLVRCSSPDCLRIFCIYCNAVTTHAAPQCPTLTAFASADKDFDPKNGRRCPHFNADGTKCPGECIQHYRDDGCHLVQCHACYKFLCFVCGAPKYGSIHENIFQGKTCSCPPTCGPGCVCISPPLDKDGRPTVAAYDSVDAQGAHAHSHAHDVFEWSPDGNTPRAVDLTADDDVVRVLFPDDDDDDDDEN